MQIEKNEKELYALELFHNKERDRALEVQTEFVEDLRQAVAEGMDHCPCKSTTCA